MERLHYSRSVGAVAAGLAGAAAFTYAFHVAGARSLDVASFGVFGALWSFFFLLVIVAFLGLEQTVVAGVARGGWPLAGTGERRKIIALGMMAAALPLASRPLWAADVGWLQLAILSLGFLGYLSVYLLRGVAAGSRSFVLYGSLFTVESASRLVVLGTLAFFGPLDLTDFTLAMAGAPWMTLLVFGRFLSNPSPRREPIGLEFFAIGAIGLGNLSLMAMLNLGPVFLLWRGLPEESALLFATLVLVRGPLYFFQSVTATVLPKLADVIDVEGPARAWSKVRKWSALLAGSGALIASFGAPLAGWVAKALFGESLRLGAFDYAVLGTAVALILGSVLMNQFYVAAKRQAVLGKVWVAGLLVFAAVAWVGTQPRLMTELAVTLASGMTFLVLLLLGPRSSWMDLPLLERFSSSSKSVDTS